LRPAAKAYLVPLGRLTWVRLHALADYYRHQYGLDVAVTAPVPLDASAFDPRRGQFVAESLIVLMRRAAGPLAEDPSAVLIGITQQDMYIARRVDWRWAFSYRTSNAAVVSSARMRPFLGGLRGQQPLVQTRARKMVTKNLGILVYRLPPSRDPSSVLFDRIAGVDDLDVMRETFEGLGASAVVSGFETKHRQAPQAAELKRTAGQQPPVDAQYPCFVVRAIGRADAAVPRGTIGNCPPDIRATEAVDTLEVDLRFGAVAACRTDMVVSDVVPLVLTRCHRAGDDQSRAFGMGGNMPYDAFPVGNRQPYTWMDLILADGARVHYDRISKGTGYADAVYEHLESATKFRGSRVRWNGNGWDLRFADGALWQFPEAYAAMRGVEGGLRLMRDGAGRAIVIERDRHANLVRLRSPTGRTITFEYDRSHRTTHAVASTGARMTYEYDAGGRLTTVKDNVRTVLRYAYDRALLRAAYDEADRPLYAVDYEDGWPARVMLGGRAAYTLRFVTDAERSIPVTTAFVVAPDGTESRVSIADGERRE
jgi:YD repeat-containing protein